MLFPLVNHFEVLPFYLHFSNAHCGIHYSVILNNDQPDKHGINITNKTQSISKPVWIGPEAETFRNYLSTDDIAAFVGRVDELSLRNDSTKADICCLTT